MSSLRSFSSALATVAFTIVAATQLSADSPDKSVGELKATIEIPKLQVAEYHRPYIAVWIETPDRKIAAHLAVWYDTKMPNKEGETWLKDLRQWWRKGGRSLEFPVDAVSGPTRPVGEHELVIPLDSPLVSALKPGSYFFVVEASREVGGREMLRLPFELPGETKSGSKDDTDAKAEGDSELGKVTLKIRH